MRWLVTAFEPFAGAETNSSLLVLRELQKLTPRDVEFFAPLPVTFAGAWAALSAHLGTFDGVLALGQAERRSKISLERVALNWMNARVPDNAGARPIDERIEAEGPEIRWGNIPWEKIELPLHCELSYTAGLYVCNQLFYLLMDWANRQGKLAGFVHLPLLESQKDPEFEGLVRIADTVAVEEMAALLEQLVRL